MSYMFPLKITPGLWNPYGNSHTHNGWITQQIRQLVPNCRRNTSYFFLLISRVLEPVSSLHAVLNCYFFCVCQYFLDMLPRFSKFQCVTKNLVRES